MTEIPAPAELQHLTRVIGDDAVLALIEARGGTRVYVGARGRRGDDKSSLAMTIGDLAAGKLAAEFGTEYLSIPIARAWRCRIYRARGMTVSQIARRLLVSEKAVYGILQQRQPGHTQLAFQL